LLAYAPLHAEDWLPVSAEELKMTGEPKAPSAPAIFLYRQVDRDDNAPFENVYARIKILTEEGRKYADVEIPYNKGTEGVRNIEARTIRPDGSIARFDGTIFEKPLIRGRGIKLHAKTFTLPDVQVGSIIEYRYRHSLQSGFVFDSHWILSDELFTKHATFSLLQSTYFSVRYGWPIGLPPGTNVPTKDRGRFRLETHDVPAFITEDYMPPENQLKYRVDFVYLAEDNHENDPAAFWKKFGKSNFREVANFVDERRLMQQAVAQIVAASDTPETKLRKLYARAQQIRNVSFERKKSEQEAKREAQKDAKDVGDVWTRGYGNADEITWLFLALARAAGFEADPVLISSRDRYFFSELNMNPNELNTNLVVVKLDGKDWFLDPGMACAPFGLLPWSETGVKGLRLDKNGGTWITTPPTTPSDSRIIRKADLKLDQGGSLEGKVTVTYTGLEALWRRIEERNEDDTDRTQFMEDQIKYDIPTGIDVKLTNKPDWTSSEPTLVAEYDLTVPGWASGAGQRTLLAVGLFGSKEKRKFETPSRVHPLYFNFAYKSEDDITIQLPEGMRISSLPPSIDTDLKVIAYKTAFEDRVQSLHLNRDLIINMILVDRKYYSQLRDFYQTVRTHDEQQVVIAPGKAPARR
jgi:hypothetical protein